MSDSEPPKKRKTEAKRKCIQIITDIDEWERLLREVPLKSGEIRFYRGVIVKTKW